MADPNVFHQHLDGCAQCREHPFGLCSTGAKLLEQAALDINVADLAARVNQNSLQRSGHAPTNPCETCGGTKLIQKPYANGCGFYSRKCPTCKGTSQAAKQS